MLYFLLLLDLQLFHHLAKYRNGFTKNIELGWQGDRMKFIPKENVVYEVVNTNVKQDEFEIF